VPTGLFVAAFSVYAATLAPATLFGDPSEYQFVPAIAGIAHPPGYALYTLVAWLWQRALPLGTVAYRTNLLAAAIAAATVVLTYLTAVELAPRAPDAEAVGLVSGLFAAVCLAVAADFWQHAIHANAHIMSAALAVLHLWLLVRWWRSGNVRWLAAFAFTLGLGVTHHPITLIGVPAYGAFILATQPRLWRQWRTLLILLGCLLVGLVPWLYFPLRSPSAPFGPTDMHTWQGFWRHATAQGLRVNLFHFGLADQPDRALVFLSLLSVQFPLPVIVLIPVGLACLARRAPKPALLLGLFTLFHLAFTLNTVQDVMAYLLLPFSALAVMLGPAGAVLAAWLRRLVARVVGARPEKRCASAALWVVLLFVWPLGQAGLNLARGISLRDFRAAEEYVATVHATFGGAGRRVRLLSAWEYLTPLWVHAYTQGEPLDKQDVKPVFVPTHADWGPALWANLEKGPVYLPDFRPAVREEGLRLVPEGRFYRAMLPPVSDVRPPQPLDEWADGRIHLLGYDLLTDTVTGGDWLELTLYQTISEPLDAIWMPYAHLGPLEMRWTTDSRLLTPEWQPGEIIAERYEIPVPFGLAPGEYPLRLGYADLSGGRPVLSFSGGRETLTLTTVTVRASPARPPQRMLGGALANLGNQVALVDARVWAGWQGRSAPWQEPLPVRAGRPLHIILRWGALASPRVSYTVFIHVLDADGRYVSGHDYTPLGGSCPTYLWFPKWLRGQTFADPYRLVLPPDLPPGSYWLEVGMYGMTSLRRLPVVDSAGNLAGDRVILGPLRVE
jgi:hypothetical protein